MTIFEPRGTLSARVNYMVMTIFEVGTFVSTEIVAP